MKTLAIWVAGILIVAVQIVGVNWRDNERKPVVFEQTAYAQEPIAHVVLIEPKIDWTEDRIKEEIRTVFHEKPELFVKIASCEGVRNGHIVADAHNPKTNDDGVFQINEAAHGEEVKELGLDMMNPKDNIQFARMLYDRNGVRDWSASKSCWSK